MFGMEPPRKGTRAFDRPQLTPERIFCERLREARIDRDWSQFDLSELCRKAGVRLNRVAITKLEAGERRPRLNEVIGLAAVLGISPVQLFTPKEAGRMAVTPKSLVEGSAVRNWCYMREPLDPDDERFYFAHISDDEWEGLAVRAGVERAIGRGGDPDDYERTIRELLAVAKMLEARLEGKTR
jgi:transcriptional regulator with XRE-family HTH domain